MNSTILMFEQLESRILLSGSPMPEGQCEVPAVEVSVEANQSSEQQQLVNEIVIIDSKVKDYQSIIDSLQKNVEIYIVDSTSDGIKKITSILEDRQGIEALHIISHGSSGQVQLGNSYLNNDNLDTYQEELRSWKNSLTESADILIYGCNVGQNTSFLENLSYLTDADIAASDDLTGAAGLGGDWELEVTHGKIDTQNIDSPQYHGLLATVSNTTNPYDSTAGGAFDVGQSFTANASGTLSSIKLANNVAGTFTLEIYSGAGVAGSLLHTQTITTSDTVTDLTTYTLESHTINSTVNVTNGQSYTFQLKKIATNHDLLINQSIYAGGDVYASGTAAGPDDLLFEVEINTNSAPSLGGTPADDTATEDVATAIDLSAYNISDADGDTITLTLGVDRGTIASVDGNGTTSGVTIANSGTASMTLQGTAANLNTYLNDTSKIEYTTASNDTTAATLTVTPNDGTVNGTADTVTINISAVNDAPTATGIPTDVTVTEDTASNVDLSSVTFTDVDGDSLTITLEATAGTFASSSGGGVTIGGSGTSTLTLSGTAANINTFLDTVTNIQYTGASNVNDNDAASFTIKANDGTVNPTLGTVNIDITAVNDAPTATGVPTDVTVTEDTASNIDFSSITFADIDSATLTVTLTASAGTFSTPADGAGVGGGVTETLVSSTVITLVGSPADINTYLDTASNIQYTGANNVSGNDAATITVTANDGDGSGNVNLGTVNVDITAVNDAPTATGIPTDITVTEDTASNVDLSAVTFTDVDGDSLTITLEATAGTFASSSGGGVTVGGSGTATLTLSGTAANINTFLDTVTNIQYTGASNVNGNDAASFTIKANDGTVNPTLGTVNLDITAVNDAPTATGVPTDITIVEDTASNVNFSSITFADIDSATITVTLTASAGTFSTPADGAGVGGGVTETLVSSTVITLVGSPADINTYLDTASNIQYTGATNVSGNDAATITVTANDGDGSGNVNLGTVNVDITAVNDAPTATGIPTDVTVTEDTASNVNLSAVTFTDVDDDSLTVTLEVTAGTFASSSGGGVTVGGSGTSTLTLSGTAANINTFLDTVTNIQYTGASNVNGNDAASFTIKANDGTVNPTLGTVNIDITAVNDAPTATGVPTDVTVTEDTASNVDFSAITFSDIDSATITVTLTASAGTFSTPADGAGVGGGVTETLVSSTVITLVGSPADINTYLDTASNIQYTGANNVSGNDAATITVTANDGDGSGNVNLGTVNIDITAVNDAPTATGIPTDVTVTEDTASNVDLSAVTFTDVDGDSLTITLEATAGTFASSSGGGVTVGGSGTATLTLSGTAANINTFLDTVTNIQYTGATNVSGNDAASFTIKANDGTVNPTLGTVNIDITGVNDAPTATGIPTDITVFRDTASNVNLSSVTFTDVDGDSLTVTLAASAGTFTSTSGGGVTIGGSGTSTLTLSGTAANINTFLDTVSNIQYTGALGVSGDNAATFQINVNDGTVNPNLGTVNIDINIPPVVVETPIEQTTYVRPTPATPLDSYEIIVEAVKIFASSGQGFFDDLLNRILIAGVNEQYSTFKDKFRAFRFLDIIPPLFFDKYPDDIADFSQGLDPDVKDSKVFEKFQISPEAQKFIDDLNKHLDELEEKEEGDDDNEFSFSIENLMFRNTLPETFNNQQITQENLDFRDNPGLALVEEFDCFKI